MNRLPTFLAAVLLAAACSSSDAPPIAADSSDLVNGKVASPTQFPATFRIVDNCTVTRVGTDLILSAAHCVRDDAGEIIPMFDPGEVITLELRGQRPRLRNVRILETKIHPQLAHVCSQQPCRGAASLTRRDAPDLAVIKVTGSLDGITIADIEVDAPQVDDEVTLVGYGCTDSVSQEIDGELRYLHTKLVAIEGVIHDGGLAPDEHDGLGSVRANYVVTPGPSRPTGTTNRTAGGLCNGDSGGAVFRRDTNHVVGVNASYTFLPAGIDPVTNWHSRVDGKARWGTARWLESLGVQMSKPCSAQACEPTGTEADRD